ARSFNWDRTAATTWNLLAQTAAESRSEGRAFPMKARGGHTDARKEQDPRSKTSSAIGSRSKILHIIGMAHGGAGQHVLSLSTGCDRRYFESTVAMAADNPMRTQFERAGVRVLALETNQYDGLRRNVAAYRQLSEILQRESFDLINTHTMV